MVTVYIWGAAHYAFLLIYWEFIFIFYFLTLLPLVCQFLPCFCTCFRLLLRLILYFKHTTSPLSFSPPPLLFIVLYVSGLEFELSEACLGRLGGAACVQVCCQDSELRAIRAHLSSPRFNLENWFNSWDLILWLHWLITAAQTLAPNYITSARWQRLYLVFGQVSAKVQTWPYYRSWKPAIDLINL